MVLSGAIRRLRRGGWEVIFCGFDAPCMLLGHELQIFLQHSRALLWNGWWIFMVDAFLRLVPSSCTAAPQPSRGGVLPAADGIGVHARDGGPERLTISQGVLCARLRLA